MNIDEVMRSAPGHPSIGHSGRWAEKSVADQGLAKGMSLTLAPWSTPAFSHRY